MRKAAKAAEATCQVLPRTCTTAARRRRRPLVAGVHLLTLTRQLSRNAIPTLNPMQVEGCYAPLAGLKTFFLTQKICGEEEAEAEAEADVGRRALNSSASPLLPVACEACRNGARVGGGRG